MLTATKMGKKKNNSSTEKKILQFLLKSLGQSGNKKENCIICTKPHERSNLSASMWYS